LAVSCTYTAHAAAPGLKPCCQIIEAPVVLLSCASLAMLLLLLL
jgi:hypothetical protein